MKIFISKIGRGTTDKALKDLLERYGEVKGAKVIIDKDTGISRRFAFVEMPNDEEAAKAIEEFNGFLLKHFKMVVKKANPRESKASFKMQP